MKLKSLTAKFLALCMVIGSFSASGLGAPQAAYASVSERAVNGGFEEPVGTGDTSGFWVSASDPSVVTGEYAPEWRPVAGSGNKLGFSVVSDVSHSGAHSLRATANEGRSFITQTIPLDIPADTGKIFRLHAWIKTEDVTAPINMRIMPLNSTKGSGGPNIETDRIPAGTRDWTELSKEVTVAEGVCYLKIQANLGYSTVISGTVFMDDVSLTEVIPVTSLTLNQTAVSVPKYGTATLIPGYLPEDATYQTVTWTTSNPSVASVSPDGVVTAVEEGTATITATNVGPADVTKTAACQVTVVPPLPVAVTGITLDQTSAAVPLGNNFFLKPSIEPADAANQNIIWSSSDTGVATVRQNSFVQTVGSGSASITAVTEDGGFSAACGLTVTPYTPDSFDGLRVKWVNSLLAGQDYDLTDPSVQAMVNNVASAAQELWSSIDPSSTRTCLWAAYPFNAGNSADLTASYKNLLTMAQAYVLKGSQLKGNTDLLKDIIDALDWMNINKYNTSKAIDGNWWDFEIGTPKMINDIVAILYNNLTSLQINNYTDAIYYFQPDPSLHGRRDAGNMYNRPASGGNLADTVKVAVMYGINRKDASQINAGRDALSASFLYVTGGEGMYSDGSFVQHIRVPYNNTYGQAFLLGLADVISELDGSAYEVTDSNLNNVYEWIIKGVEPYIYKGSAMDMASGRSIARGGGEGYYEDHSIGHGLMSALVKFAGFAPQPYAYQYKSMLKYWMKQDTYMNYIDNLTSLGAYNIKKAAREILNNPFIIATSLNEIPGHYMFTNQDQVINRTLKYSFAISMYSSRIWNYESMNGENLHGWHTADGMTYLYNGDLGNFADGFWATVNPYRLPGITVDPWLVQGDAANVKIASTQSWVGGASLGQYGITGMSMDKQGYSNNGTTLITALGDLKAKKSWFMFGDEIVALGSGISCTSGNEIETIVDNRKISDADNNILTVNDLRQPDSPGVTRELQNVSWMHVAGDTPNSDVGYYFPGGASVYSLREARTGKWSDINTSGSTAPVTKNYLATWVSHGVNPAAGTYAYVLLPNMTKKQVKSYAQSPDTTILMNTPQIQAVRKNSLKMLGANFWTDGQQSVDIIGTDKQSSIMVKETTGYYEISVSDPTMLNTGNINVEIKGGASSAVSLSPGITVTQLYPTIKFSVNVNGSKGQTFTARFARKKEVRTMTTRPE